MIKAVVFDMGGVILTMDSTPETTLAHAKSTIAFLGEHGIHIPDPPEVFAKKLAEADRVRRRTTEEELREILALEVWADFFLKDYHIPREKLFPIAEELCLRWNRDRYITAPRLGLRECLQGLWEQGMRMGVISNTISRTFMRAKLAEFGVIGYFDYVLLSSVCGLRKPDPAIFELCRTSMGLAKSELAYVGDTISRDVIGTLDAGWELMIRIATPTAKEHVVKREQALENSGYEPHYRIDELDEIPAIIQGYNAAHGRLTTYN